MTSRAAKRAAEREQAKGERPLTINERNRLIREAGFWRVRATTLLDVLNAVLWAYGQGPEHRLAISREMATAAQRRPVHMEEAEGGHYVLYIEPEPVTEDSEPDEELVEAMLRAHNPDEAPMGGD